MSSSRLGYVRLYKHLDKILMLFVTSFLVLDYVWRPLNSWLAGVLLAETGFQFLSYNNALQIIIRTPLVFAGMVGLFLLNIFVAYFQIVYLFRGLYNLFGEKRLGLREFIRQSWADAWTSVRALSLPKVIFISFYIIVLFPILRSVLNIYYLNKILIPTFIMDYLLQNLWVSLLILIGVLAIFYLSIRWMFALPQLLFEGKTVREAVTYSWQKTHKHFWAYTWRLVWIVLKTSLFYLVTVFFILLLQVYADAQSQIVTNAIGVFNYSLIKLTYYMMVSYFLLKYMSLLTGSVPHVTPAKQHPILRIGIVTFAMVIFAFEGVYDLLIPYYEKPLIISHRGVSDGNGVQNTIESLEETVKLKPDLVEMDVQETADGQFVLMHDPDLQSLAGVDATAQELTLEELTELTVSENGHDAKIPSFEAYLDRADALGQKLLIEIKTSSQDSKDMMQRFLTTYGPRIKAKGHEMHSLDFSVVNAVINYDKTIPVYFILPYNTIFPQTQATGYTMEYSTLDSHFTDRVSDTGKKVYDWTINDDEAVSKSLRLDVDGMITDDLPLVQEAVEQQFTDHNLYQLLVNQAVDYLNVFAL